ncbi:MAG: GNAT family N-acetyltransferase [Acidimicrobiales bacterium]
MLRATFGNTLWVALLPDHLVTSDLELQRWRLTMVDQMIDAVSASFEELRQWMPWAQVMPARDDMLVVVSGATTLFDADEEWNYALFERSTRELVGSVGVRLLDDPDCPEIGYWVRSDRTGRGYATGAARALIESIFQYFTNVDEVKIRMDQANRASAAVPPKLGFTRCEEEDRPIEAAGHTGRGFIWRLRRDEWHLA